MRENEHRERRTGKTPTSVPGSASRAGTLANVTLRQRLWGLVRMSRPVFLAGGVVFYVLGVAIASFRGVRIDLSTLVVGQLAIAAIQLTTHFANEYFDLKADLLNPSPTRWADGNRVLPDGLLPPWTALAVSLLGASGAASAILILWLTFDTSPPVVFLLVAALVLGWGYSAPPFRLESRGLGELDVAVVTSGLTPLIGYSLQAGEPTAAALLAVLPICVLQVAVSMAANFSDFEGDRMAGKGTLVVCLGPTRSARLNALLLVASYFLLPIQVVAGLPYSVPLAVAVSAPLGGWLAYQMFRGRWSTADDHARLCFWTNGLSAATVALMGASLVWLSSTRGLDSPTCWLWSQICSRHMKVLHRDALAPSRRGSKAHHFHRISRCCSMAAKQMAI